MRIAPIALLALAACAHGPAPDPMNEATASLAAAETTFAAHSVREGMRAAFLANFADDGVFVRAGGWLNSNAYLAKQPDPPIVLDWRPAYVEAAASGDLGLSTGPWKLTSKASPSESPAYGQFVSVWRREGAGPWRVAVDLGIAHPGPQLWDQPLLERPARTEPGGGAKGIEAAEAAFAKESSGRGLRAAYETLGSERLRFYRGGADPAIGKAASLAAPGMGVEKLAWKVERIEASRAGDFGYARGAYSDPASGAVLGSYLRVWRHEGGAWRVILDVTNPAPPKVSS